MSNYKISIRQEVQIEQALKMWSKYLSKMHDDLEEFAEDNTSLCAQLKVEIATTESALKLFELPTRAEQQYTLDVFEGKA